MSVSSLAKAFRLGAQPVVGYTKRNIYYIVFKSSITQSNS
ncbi:MAG: hypothetical protein Ct9H300mP18_14620 [Candidatus Neomarinimicrobiota bacterium]|nr:MAG: hypothetical protein Ct9H300mP18_14620 [Candidatus Neomarinimicrobiota bacterium]